MHAPGTTSTEVTVHVEEPCDNTITVMDLMDYPLEQLCGWTGDAEGTLEGGYLSWTCAGCSYSRTVSEHSTSAPQWSHA